MMNKISKVEPTDQEHPFVKGMTLEQYMSKTHFDGNAADSLEEIQEENLYESSHYGCRDTKQTKKRNYRID